ncbi:protein VASCULATURE COMPLEXITY AND CONNECTIVITY-like [Aristolochia californica]|uniref:protein VASCULATURE COMPLEXITY AND CONNECTIVITY-like n=1 Tax=Aristolochia californica TaxID=171875 RepID=UPI0035DBD2E0
MAKIGGAFVCLLIVVMDIVAGVVGIQAEMAQNKVHHLKFLIFECKDPSEQAFRLGLAAAGILALAHVIANLLGGCMCICSKEEFVQSSANRQLAVACLFLSWIILAVGFSMLLIGAMYNNKMRTSCGFSHHNFLSIGGILCFVHGLFCAAYYVSANAITREDKPSRRGIGSQMT